MLENTGLCLCLLKRTTHTHKLIHNEQVRPQGQTAHTKFGLRRVHGSTIQWYITFPLIIVVPGRLDECARCCVAVEARHNEPVASGEMKTVLTR